MEDGGRKALWSLWFFWPLPVSNIKPPHTLTVRQTPLSHGGKTGRSLCACVSVCVCVTLSPNGPDGSPRKLGMPAELRAEKKCGTGNNLSAPPVSDVGTTRSAQWTLLHGCYF